MDIALLDGNGFIPCEWGVCDFCDCSSSWERKDEEHEWMGYCDRHAIGWAAILERRRIEAAAPMLLVAAKIAHECLLNLTTDSFSRGGDVVARDALRSAIAKAEGREP